MSPPIYRSTLSSCIYVAIKNTFNNPKRSITATAGICLSILLVLVQLGFLNATKKATTLLYEDFDFDIAIVSNDFQFLYKAPSIDRIRLTQAQGAIPDILDTFQLNIKGSRWSAKETDINSSLMLIGIENKPAFILDPNVKDNLDGIVQGNNIIIDSFSHKDYGDISVGVQGKVNRQDVNIISSFQLGMFFFAEGSAIVDNGQFVRLSGRASRDLSIGLIKIKPGANTKSVVSQLTSLLPDDVIAFDRKSFIEREQDYFIEVKPIGIMFRLGTLVAYIVGMTILYQVLATDITNKLKEFATMKAIGLSQSFIYGIGITQMLIYITISFIPAITLTFIIFYTTYTLTKMPIELTPDLILTVAIMTLVMGIVSGIMALNKVRSADPAELF
jgi:putative ABC transport system permease protein